jgi:hypothetical protein
VRGPPAEALEQEEKDPVEDQERGGRGGRGEQRPKGVLEQEPQGARRDGADDEQPAEAGVGVSGSDLPVTQRPSQAAEDPRPVVTEDQQEHQGGRHVGGDQEGEEVVVVLMDVPAEQAREDHPVAQAGDRKGLGDALNQAKDDGLEV